MLRQEFIEQMKEDLIETLTTLVFQRSFSKLLVAFCRASTHDKEIDLQDNLKIFLTVKPRNIGIDQYFTLDASSKIEQIFID